LFKWFIRYISSNANLSILVPYMVSIDDVISTVTIHLPTAVNVVIILIAAFIAYRIIRHIIKKAILARARTKTEKSDALILLGLWKYFFTIVLLIGLIFYLGGDFTGFGLWAGLFSAALGWALQKPITGIAGWILVIIKKPFRIGDRILIDSVKGDVIDITLSHIYLKEIGGTINSEETSGRIVMIPNSIMFEKNIINYTLMDEFILDDVGVFITFESDLDMAILICEESARKVTKDFKDKMPTQPYVRTWFSGSGIDIKTRYYIKASERIRISSEITQEIFRRFKQEKDIEIAYPHTEVVLRQKKEKTAKQ